MQPPSNQPDEFYFDYVRLLKENRMLHRAGYYLGASNSFVRLFTITARRYWIAQAVSEHLTTDWKVHFSIRPRDIPRAFNLLSELYFNMKLPVGLKARYPDHWLDYENVWPAHMRGREITVYLLLYEDTSKKIPQTMLYSRKDLTETKEMIAWPLSTDRDIYAMHELIVDDEIPLDRYYDYVIEAEKLLEEYGVESNGCAVGDYPIGKYTSLRNEKYVAIEEEEVKGTFLRYPPNECGYNGSYDRRDLTKEMINLDTYRRRKRANELKTSILVVLINIVLFIVLSQF